MKSMSQLAVLVKTVEAFRDEVGPFQEVVLESSSVDELVREGKLF